MKTVKIYIETTITGPAAPKRGGYAAALTFTRRNGDIEDRFLKGEEEGTTYNRSVLLAMIYALQKLKEPCRVVFYTRNTYIKNMILADNPEKWRRAEWKKSDGKGIQNQDLWKMFLEESTEHEIEIVYEKDSEYKETLQAYLIRKYPTVRYGVMTFEDVKMRVDAGEDDEENGTIICDTQEQLEEALKKKCREQFELDVDRPKVTIEADMELLQNTELYEDVKELEKVSLGDTVHCKHSKLGILSDARVIELEWDAVRNKLTSVTLGEFQYNFLDDVSSVMSRVDQAIRSDGTLIGQQVQGIINGVKAQLKAQSTIAKKQPVRAILFEDLDSESPTYGAMCLGTLGFEIASERTADGRDWKWTTFGTGQGFYADFIVAGTMLADRIKGGTLILGGKDNGDGTAKVLDANGNVVLALTNQGIVVDHASNGGVLISNGSIFIRNTKGETVGIMHYQDNGMSIQSYGGQYASILITNEGKISINAVGEVSLSCGSLKVGGKSTKTGRAVYSDGTYLDIQNGHVVGGNTKEGSF